MGDLKKLVTLLKKTKLSVSAAESCSSGYLSYLLTEIPGSSSIFKGAVIAYSLEVKNKVFKIPKSLLNKTQGVSAGIAADLAEKIRKMFKTDIGLSIIGFAGPGARKGVKPGTVFLAVADKKGVEVKKITIKGSRNSVRQKASLALITMAYKRVTR